ncbi:MAG: DUF3352 domain-containing protein [Bacteroidota bacterium]|nr:DUF3352 domain-containing protein [Bacteroidota bacterium]
MWKKVVAIIIIAVIIISLAVFFLLKREKPLADSLYKAVPLDAALIINIKNFDDLNRSLLSNNQLWKEMATLPFFDQLNGQFRFIDSLKRLNPSINKLFTQKTPMLVSGHTSGRNDIRLICYFEVPNESDFNEISHFIKNYKGKKLQSSSRKYEEATLHDVVFPEKKDDNFTYAWSHGILLLSHSSLLIEDAVRQLNSKESVLDRKGLAEIIKTAGKSALVNFYFKFEHLSKLAERFIHPKYKTELSYLKNVGSWVELDLNLKPNMLILNGFSFADMARPGFELLFKDQKPVKMEIFSKIPSEVNTFAVFGISDYELFRKNRSQFMDSRNILSSYNHEIQTLKNDYEIDLINSFTGVFDQEAATVLTGPASDTIAQQAFSVIKTKNRDDAEKMLTGFIHDYCSKQNRKASDFMAEFPASNGQNIKVWKLTLGNIPAMLFGNLFSGNENEYCAFSDNYLIFGQSAAGVLTYISKLMPKATVNTNSEFESFSEYFSEQSNFFFYNKPSTSGSFYSNFLKEDVYKQIKTQTEHFDKIQAFAYQFNVSDNGLIYNNIFIKYSPQAPKAQQAQEPETVSENQEKTGREIKLDAPAASKPFLLKNGAGSGPDIFVQDKKNQIYLIGPDGKIRWKIKLSEPILSDIYQIDYFRNGKQQLLFNTRSKLFLIDRNGKNTGKYPIMLKSPATNGLAVFDYDKKLDYRIFIAGEDRKIQAFNKDGALLKGWEPPKTDSKVTQPVQYFRIEGKDFLVFNDKTRLYILDRKGKPVIKLSKPLSLSSNKAGLINGRSLKDARFVVSATKGKVYFIGLDGNIKEDNFGKYPDSHWFDVYDLNGDGVKELIFSWGTNLKVMSQKNKELLSLKTPAKLKYRPAFYEVKANKFKIGLVTTDEKILLYEPSGELKKGFPLNGSTPFSINTVNGGESGFKLVTGCDKNFLNEYPVQ